MEIEAFVSEILDLDKVNVPVDNYGFIVEDKVPAGIAVAAEKHLITPKGNPNYATIANVMEPKGIKVYPGEQDSFGWVTGVIETPEGRKVCVF